jgi:Fe2+ or Zn2+ uptake regulation protein
MFTCEKCNTDLEPHRQELWTEIGHKQERTGYDGVRYYITETLTLKCETCGHVDEYVSGWIVNPESEGE